VTEPPGTLWEAAAAPASASVGDDRILQQHPTRRLDPPARRDGPATSRAAARSMRSSTPAQRERVLVFIASRGVVGATDAETQTALGLGPQSVSPRRGELARLGLVRDSGARRATPSGRRAIVWIAAERGAAP